MNLSEQPNNETLCIYVSNPVQFAHTMNPYSQIKQVECLALQAKTVFNDNITSITTILSEATHHSYSLNTKKTH